MCIEKFVHVVNPFRGGKRKNANLHLIVIHIIGASESLEV